MTGLILHSLKSKKNWFLLNIAICIVIAIVLPVLFKSAFEFFAVSSLVIASIIILISIFSDLVFLHDDRKISYYLSKPISLTKRINIALISNIIFCTVTFAITFIIASSSGSILSDLKYIEFIDKYLSYVQIMYAWLMILIFVITFSSELTGNTTVSTLVSLFNFTLPLILYFITSYIFYILDSVIVGISTETMSQIYLESFLPLEKIYFMDYVNGNIDVFFFVRLFASCAIIYTLTLFFTKKRKNENTGDFIVHSSFKYFIALFASLIAPMLITTVMMGANLFNLVVVLVLLSTLSYYILISAFNKTFKISMQALKIFIPFIVIIIITIFTTAYILNEKAEYVPDTSDVKAVYIGNDMSYVKNAKLLNKSSYQWQSLLKSKYEEVKNNDALVILHEEESIKKVVELQQILMREDPTYSYRETHIIYYLNNGKKVVRTYMLPDNYQEELDEYDISVFKKLMEIARIEEFIKARYRVFTDENYIDNVKFNNVTIYSDEGTKALIDFDYETFAKCYMEDYNKFINDDKNSVKLSFSILSQGRTYEFVSQNYDKIDTVNAESGKYGRNDIYEINFENTINDGISLEYLSLNKELAKTKQYIESLKTE